MPHLRTLLRQSWRSRQGNIAITTALTAPLLIMSLALGVDFGAATLQKRTVQNQADLAAIVAAARPTDAQGIVARHFLANGLNILVKTGEGYLTPRGDLLAFNSAVHPFYEGIATVQTGRYMADPALPTEQRFKAGSAPADAVRVFIEEPAHTYFSGIFDTAMTVSASGTASTQKYAAFSIGSRLASINEGLLNGILGSLLGTKLSLKAMDYRALADLDVNLLSFMDVLATDLNLTALTYDELLHTDIGYAQLLTALGKTTGVTPNVAGILNTVGKSLGKTALTLRLDRIADLGPIGDRLVGESNNLAVTASVLQLLNASAAAANGGQQLSADLGAGIPGFADVKLTFAIGEPPVETPTARVGEPGTAVRTAQTRLSLEASVNGLSLLAGLKIRLPLYVEVAYAEARLADIQCHGGAPKNASLALDVVPAVAEVALGNLDASALQNFSTTPRITKARIVDSLLVRIFGKAHVTASNLQARRVSFSAVDIANDRVKSASTSDTLTSSVTSLLKNLQLEIDILGLSLVTPTMFQAALADSLKPVTAPLDDLLYNTLLLLGVRVGEADVRVSDVRCQAPVLVQ